MLASSGSITSKEIEREYLRDLLLWALQTHFPSIIDDLGDTVFQSFTAASKSGWHPLMKERFEKQLTGWQLRYALTDQWITVRIMVVLEFWRDTPGARVKRWLVHKDNSTFDVVEIPPPNGLPEFRADSDDVNSYVEMISENANFEISEAIRESVNNFNTGGVLTALPPSDKNEIIKAIAAVAHRYASKVVDANLKHNTSLRRSRDFPELEMHYIWLLRARCFPDARLENLGTRKIGEDEVPTHPSNVSRSISSLETRIGMSKDPRRKRGVKKGSRKSINARLGR